MSHHDSIQKHIPKVVSFNQPTNLLLGSTEPSDTSESPQLLIKGQGCITFTVEEGVTELSIAFSTVPRTNRIEKRPEKLVFKLNKKAANNPREVAGFYYNNKLLPILNTQTAYIDAPDDYNLGIDPNPKCVYWISIDSLNKILRYGKGEMRLSTVLAEYIYGKPKNIFTKDVEERYPFISDLKKISVDNAKLSHAWKEPVVVEPPAKIIPSNQFRMEDAAVQWTREHPIDRVTTPTSLSSECQVLYGNVSGERFVLNTPDFPDFDQAIEYSLKTKGCLGYEIIQAKKGEFETNKEASNLMSVEDDAYDEVYLRITLGKGQGNSPGIPYVMEIWPVGCGSPVHHHGFTNAIIRVLSGSIDVDIYRMLPIDEKQVKPLHHVTFYEGDVTYLMPQANQFHRLRNNKVNARSCITIQCYAYAKDDEIHYPKFDYVENGEEGHFDPISDCDYLKFKETVRKEWQAYKEKLLAEVVV